MSEMSKETVGLIENVINNSNEESSFLMKKLHDGTLSKDDRSKIVELISDEFAMRGLGDDEEPNEYGLQLERTIDTLLNSA